MGEGNVYEVNNLYETSFPKLTDQFFKASPWPEAEDVAPYVNDDPIFLNLYRELYFRHIYARVQGGPTVEQRFESYYNYCKLFNYILSADTPVNLELPNQWLWEIIDEFIYQFQAFSQFRSKLSKKTEEEIEMLKRNPKVWNVHSVLNVLHSLVDKSNINKMQRGEMAEFEASYTFSCPKFLSPVPPAYDAVNFDADALHKEPLRLQLKVFMEEVQQQLMLPTIRSYLKLYTTMPLDKMAEFMEMPAEEFRNHLLAFKHKMKNVVWTKGTSGLEGEFQSGSEV